MIEPGQGLEVHTLSSFQLAMRLRVVVVLTKADRVQPEELKYGLDVLDNDNAEKYFLTMLLKPKEGKEAKDESTVFRNKPWVDVKSTQKGTKNLTKAISKPLADKIQQKYHRIYTLN